ncbi:MAG: CDP-diacylglycerol--glycerol-3-phosphate 3-phosphatidyltransferase [Phycisphaerales bacterium]|nr:CDP-diacylglycerol--glycerol-3-phosphate 3-phosphatidyltransferase [Phycisphaerales bacterium]
MKINLPNQITIARLFLSIILFGCLAFFSASDPQPKLWLLDICTALFLIAALSDALDGYLARKQNEITSFGRILDPFVDKILVCGTFAFLAGDGFVNAQGVLVSDVQGWMLVVILGRELLVTSLRGVTEGGGQSFGANLYGKTKMVLQSATAVTVLVTIAHPDGIFGTPWFTYGRVILLYLTVIVTLLSMFSYLHAARGVLLHMSVSGK